MILLLGAMNEEISVYLDYAYDIKKTDWNGFAEYAAKIGNNDVLISKTGVGKSMSALFTQHLVEVYRPDFILFTGLAGALNTCLEIGDILIAEDCIQYDLDASELGFRIGQIPFTDFRLFQSDKKLFDIARDSRPDGFNLHTGRILTGDKFVSVKNRGLHTTLFAELKGDAVEMEGASVALVSAVNNIPFLLIRAISDKADGNAPKKFNDFLALASRHMLDIIVRIIKQL
ncbi:MAG: 5'-methylthioadenosine/adenosylhomocysteine nucleosidase [Spirochaetales bacterium]|nr:5'-methylthioadenosine/adenosylhomocysteine nucleosidase [Spirochaetales bacterium]